VGGGGGKGNVPSKGDTTALLLMLLPLLPVDGGAPPFGN
jgi:hypothetical protein